MQVLELLELSEPHGSFNNMLGDYKINQMRNMIPVTNIFPKSPLFSQTYQKVDYLAIEIQINYTMT